MRDSAATSITGRGGRASGPANQPSVALARNHTPMEPEMIAWTIRIHSPCHSSTGLKKNMNGTMKVARPILSAIHDVLHGSACAMPAAANEASATGGGVGEITAKEKMKMCAAS